MSDKASFLRDCVITTASDDYENFELIFEQTKQLVKITNEAEVAEALRSLIDDGLLEAYELSAQPAYAKKVDYSAGRLHELWYYVTSRGKELVKGIGGIPSLSGRFQESDRESGFSLIELLIVVAIILIIAAISIPNLLRSRMAANEASAVGSIRTLNVAALEYQSTYGAFPATLAQVGTTAGASLGCNNAELVDAVITGGNKSGYTLTLVPGTQAVVAGLVPKGCTPGFSDGYVVIANPVSIGTTGQRAFCSDATGVIRANPTGTALYMSPLCDQTQSPLQ